MSMAILKTSGTSGLGLKIHDDVESIFMYVRTRVPCHEKHKYVWEAIMHDVTSPIVSIL